MWVGLIALLGVDAETGGFMLRCLHPSYDQAKKEGRLKTPADLRAADREYVYVVYIGIAGLPGDL